MINETSILQQPVGKVPNTSVIEMLLFQAEQISE